MSHHHPLHIHRTRVVRRNHTAVDEALVPRDNNSRKNSLVGRITSPVEPVRSAIKSCLDQVQQVTSDARRCVYTAVAGASAAAASTSLAAVITLPSLCREQVFLWIANALNDLNNLPH